MRIMPNSQIYTAMSTFSGAGGFDLGFESTGRVQVLETHDSNEKFVKTLLINQGKSISSDLKIALNETLICHSDLGDPEFLKTTKDQREKFDIIYGGPPCQSFSVAGKRLGLQDLRGSLIYSFLEILENTNPKGFIFENVPGFRSIHGGQLKQTYTNEIEKLGYSIWSGILNAADFGSATFRQRFFIIGVKGNQTLRPPKQTHLDQRKINNLQKNLFEETFEPWVKCGDVLKKISSEAVNRNLPNHVFVKHTAEVKERFSKLVFGERDQIRRRNRLDPNLPAHTIFVGGKLGKLQARTHIHPFEDREITPRECAALHGFPNDWELSGNLDDALLQVANSVPVPLAKSVASYLLENLDQNYN